MLDHSGSNLTINLDQNNCLYSRFNMIISLSKKILHF